MGIPVSLIALASLFTLFILHLLSARLVSPFFPPRSRQTALIRLGILNAALCTLSAMVLAQNRQESFIWGKGLYILIVSLGFGFFYFLFFTMSETARRIRILTFWYETKSCQATDMQKLMEAYNPEEMILQRLERLEAMKLVTIKDGKYFAPMSGLLLGAHAVFWMRKLFGL